jgi:hypothetical protein
MGLAGEDEANRSSHYSLALEDTKTFENKFVTLGHLDKQNEFLLVKAVATQELADIEGTFYENSCVIISNYEKYIKFELEEIEKDKNADNKLARIKELDGVQSHMQTLQQRLIGEAVLAEGNGNDLSSHTTSNETEVTEKLDSVKQKLDFKLKSKTAEDTTQSPFCQYRSGATQAGTQNSNTQYAETQYDSALQLERQHTSVRHCLTFNESEISPANETVTPTIQIKKNTEEASVTCAKLPLAAESLPWKSPYLKKSKPEAPKPSLNKAAYCAACEELDRYTVKQLQLELKKNGQSQQISGGGKDWQVHAVADGRTHGKLPKCPLCRRGKLRSNPPPKGGAADWKYRLICPGYWDDRANVKMTCEYVENSPFESGIQRSEWMKC